MGLDCSHDAFSGAYSAFNSFRKTVCRAFGGSFPPHGRTGLDDSLIYFAFDDSGKPVNTDVPDGIIAFLTHSDCDGALSPAECAKVADDLEKLLPAIEKMTGTPWSGHVERGGGYVAVTKQFIAGCRAAHAANEPLEFT